MIVVKLQGGLGNQLFQWSIGKNISCKYNVPLYLDTNFYKLNLPGTTKRDFSLNKFPNLNYELIESARNNGRQFLRVSEPQQFTNINYNPSYNLYLDGYFQSEKYFLESSDVIKSQLSPDDTKLSKINSIIDKNRNNISLHIRRTDYLTSNGFHPVQSIDYYKESIELIGDYDFIYVFSDDVEWCKNNLSFKNMIFVDGNDDIEDIWIMSMCKNNIIANSSFSWWGAWLNNNPNKKIIAPKNWFGNGKSIDMDLIPNSWIKI